MRTDRSNAPFFVLGAARSGTTLLRLMLNRHPRLAIPPESHFLIPLLRELPVDRLLSPAEIRRTAEIIIRHPRFATWHVPANVLVESFGRKERSYLRELIDWCFRLEISRSGKPRWGDKTPRYYECWEQVVSLFPEAKLIHLIRDGRDVSASLRRVGWHGRTEFERAQYWSSRVSMAHQALRRLGPETCMIVRYEDLVLNSEPVLKDICMFLEEEFAPTMLRFFEDAEEHVPDFDGPVHPKINRPPAKGDVQRWRRESTWLRVLLFESIAGRALDQARYRRMFGGPCRAAMPAIGRWYATRGVGLERECDSHHGLAEWKGARHAFWIRALSRRLQRDTSRRTN